ncbi:MAG TPA: asparagine synthase (glutamine-hydrolyzing) [Bryobacteraceae bacterium]|nr:asparagine synthase (glutamine-hydrolyzing) [Bryobacteraceae bacterium]
MCGIAGFLDRASGMNAEALQAVNRRMTDAIAHRGPDDEGIWADPTAGIALGHRRLSILDLSPEGHQPMHSANGAFVIVFNGEIYNFRDIRAELESHGHRFRGHSDTEIMLAAFEQWGVRRAVETFNGMFSFAVWDKRERLLHLCRDRLGKKPMYYGWAGKTLLFGSELKAFHQHPNFSGQIDRNIVPVYLRHGYIPAPYSIYQGIYKLPAGSLLTIRTSDVGTNGEPEPYWSVLEAARKSMTSPLADERESLEQLEQLLQDAVRIRMVADVPVGAFLSGGIDSSLVVALMQSSSSLPVRTFSIGFNEAKFDEAQHAKAVAQHLGCDHTELYVTPAEVRNVIPILPEMFDEPFADSSMIPTFLVSQLTRRSVTVALSGDGGDELFGGYSTYDSCARYFQRNGRWPGPVRRMAAHCATAVSSDIWDAALRPAGIRHAGPRLHRVASIFGEDAPGLAYRAMVSLWEFPQAVACGGVEATTPFADSRYRNVGGDEIATMMLLDTSVYLPDDILVKVDRASMAVSLESRCPLLDYRLFELAWRIPMSLKRRDGSGKWILKQLAYKLVSRELLDRPKAGFAIPIVDWLRGPLRAWGEELLAPERLREEGFFNPRQVQATWRAHQEGHIDYSARLWTVLMFQAWLEHYHKGENVASPPMTAVSS